VRTRSKQQWIKIVSTGRVSVFRDPSNPSRFEVSWRRANGSYGRRRFNADSVEQAIETAPVIAGLVQATPDVEGITLLDGFTQAMSETRRGSRGRADWLYQQTRFLEWLARSHPTVTHWHQVTRQIVKDYLRRYEGRSPNHRRLTLQPVIQTAGYLEREFQMPNVTRKLGIGNANVRETPTVFLADVVSLADFLKDRHPRLEVGVALQGLAALRLTEALRITWGKVDLRHGIIEVSGETKTSWSNRTIPVAARVHDALRRAWEIRPNAKVVDPQAPVVVSPKGRSYMAGTTSYHNYTKDLRKAVKEWNAEVGWRVKDLRNAVPTALAMAGLACDASEQYMGHAPKGITARHYIPRLSAVTKGEKAAFAHAMQVFKTPVVEHIEHLASGSEAEILNFFEPASEPGKVKEA
jgi:integrase